MALELCKNGHYFDGAKTPNCPFCSLASGPQPGPGRAAPVGDLLVGWLVVIDGPQRGADFRLRGARCEIGRAAESAICLAEDSAISRRAHAYILYDPAVNRFALQPGSERGLCYCNGELAVATVPLKPGDQILIGGTTLVFVPLTGDHFRWS